MAAKLGDKLRQAPPGVSVGSLIAKGEAEIGFQQYSELMGVPGITVAGPLPPGAEIISTFTACVCAKASDRKAASEFRSIPGVARNDGCQANTWLRARMTTPQDTPENTMIIDCHGHYTTAPKALEDWRNRQIAGLKDSAMTPKVADLKISRRRPARNHRYQSAKENVGAR